MPHIVYTQPAIEDLIRLRAFLASKSETAAEKAKREIIQSIKSLSIAPEAYKPVPGEPYLRDMVIKFGVAGYIIRYRYERGGNIYILRIRHQKEAGFTENEVE
jgi:plasmid stabilization system protein ParE